MSSKKPVKKTLTKQSGQSRPVDIRFASYGLLGALSILLYYYCKSFDFIQDDSFITFRYVKNFTEGNGLVFNIAERVEGYTCFLWVMLLSGVRKLGFDFVSASQTIGFIFSALTLLCTFLISSRIFPKGKDALYNLVFSLIAVVLVAANGSFAYWTVSGMETAMFGFLVTLAVYMYLKELKLGSALPLSSIAFLLASMTRPEGNLIFAVTALHKLIITFRKPPPEGSTRMQMLFSKSNLYWLLIYLIPAVIFMIWRYSYYGYLLPNTFYAKTGSSAEYFKAGFVYFWEFTKSYGGYGVLTLLTLLTLRNKERLYDFLYLVLLFFVFCAYVIFVGGDVLRPNRFFVPLMPVFFILVQEGLSELLGIFDKKKAFALGALIGAAFAIGFSYYTYTNEFDQIKRYSVLEKGLVEKMKITGTWLKNKQQQAGRPLVVAATTIGSVSYYSEVFLIDMLGLTDKEIAHNPKPIPEISSSEVGWRERNYNVDYVLQRKPDLIYFSTGLKPSAYAERGLFTSDEFMKYYYPYYLTIKELNFSEIMYKRKSDEEVKNAPVLPPNPNYKKSFVNIYNQAMNTSKDKAKSQEAIDLFNQALAIGPPGWGTPYQMIGEVYMQLKDNNKALESYSKAVETDDYNVLAHYYLYKASIVKKDSVSAKLHYDKIVKYAPDLVQ